MTGRTITELAHVRRYADRGLIIDMPIEGDRLSYRAASGDNLAHILERINSDVDFMLITSFRAWDPTVEPPRAVSKVENESTFRALPAALRSRFRTKMIGAYWLIAHWTACAGLAEEHAEEPASRCEDLGGTIVDGLEYSWLIKKDDQSISEEDWMAAAIEIAENFGQSAFIMRLNGKTSVYGATGNFWEGLLTDQSILNAQQTLSELRSTTPKFDHTELRIARARGRIQKIAFRPSKTASEVPAESEGRPVGGTVAKLSSYFVLGTGTPHTPEIFLAVPHCNSARMMFSHFGVSYGLTGLVARSGASTREPIDPTRPIRLQIVTEDGASLTVREAPGLFDAFYSWRRAPERSALEAERWLDLIAQADAVCKAHKIEASVKTVEVDRTPSRSQRNRLAREDRPQGRSEIESQGRNLDEHPG